MGSKIKVVLKPSTVPYPGFKDDAEGLTKDEIIRKNLNLGIEVIKKVWLVETESEAEELTARGNVAIGVELSDSGSLRNWTDSKGVGDWDTKELQHLNGVAIKVAFNPATMASKKANEFVKTLSSHLLALGASSVFIAKVPNGETISSMNAKHSEEFLEDELIPRGKVSDEGLAILPEDTYQGIKIFEIALHDFSFHYSRVEGGFLIPRKGPQFAYMTQSGPALRNYLSDRYHDMYDDVASSNVLRDTINLIEAKCERSESKIEMLSKRSGRSKKTGAVWIDLAQDSGLFAKITKEGVELSGTPDDDVFFKRTNQIRELPLPKAVAAEDIKPILDTYLRPFFNISDAEWRMTVAWMITQIIPEYKSPIAVYLGESNSGKSTVGALIEAILEASKTNGDKMPKNPDDMAVTITHSNLSHWNNVSDLSESMTDDLCLYFEGTATKKRMLYTNDDMIEMRLNPSIIINGVTIASDLKTDIKTRMLVFQLDPMPKVSDGSIDDIKLRVLENHAEILGALYKLTSMVLSMRDEILVPDNQTDNRLSNYVSTVMSLDYLWDAGTSTYDRYRQIILDASHDSLELASFRMLHSMIVSHENWNPDTQMYEAEFSSNELINMMSGSITQPVRNFKLNHEISTLELDNSKKIANHFQRNITDWKKFGVSIGSPRQIRRTTGGERESCRRIVFNPAENQGAWTTHTLSYSTPQF